MSISKRSTAYNVTRLYAPDPARQVQALLRLLGHVAPAPETRRPQEETPGAVDYAAARNGSAIMEQLDECSTPPPSSR